MPDVTIKEDFARISGTIREIGFGCGSRRHCREVVEHWEDDER